MINMLLPSFDKLELVGTDIPVNGARRGIYMNLPETAVPMEFYTIQQRLSAADEYLKLEQERTTLWNKKLQDWSIPQHQWDEVVRTVTPLSIQHLQNRSICPMLDTLPDIKIPGSEEQNREISRWNDIQTRMRIIIGNCWKEVNALRHGTQPPVSQKESIKQRMIRFVRLHPLCSKLVVGSTIVSVVTAVGLAILFGITYCSQEPSIRALNITTVIITIITIPLITWMEASFNTMQEVPHDITQRKFQDQDEQCTDAHRQQIAQYIKTTGPTLPDMLKVAIAWFLAEEQQTINDLVDRKERINQKQHDKDKSTLQFGYDPAELVDAVNCQFTKPHKTVPATFKIASMQVIWKQTDNDSTTEG